MIALVAVALLAACERAPERPAAAPSEAAASKGGLPDGPAASPSPDPSLSVALDGEGLRLVASGSGSTRLLAFGTDRGKSDAALAKALGQSPEPSAIEECGEGPMQFSRFGGLRLSYLDDKFVGWTAERDPRFTTMDGIGPGMARAEAAERRTVVPFTESTLDNEFTFGEMSETAIGGFFENGDANARIASLNAGTNCFFR